jgi:hypothetical protein
MNIKSFYTQQHCYVFPKNLIPWWDLNPGLLVPKVDAMSSTPWWRWWHQGSQIIKKWEREFQIWNPENTYRM